MNDPSTSAKLIIQCPACRAKFALPASALDGVEFPRFHCSRCDHIFSQEESMVETEVPPPPPEPAPRAATRSLEVPRAYDPKHPAAAPQENAPPVDQTSDPLRRNAAQMEFDFSTPRRKEDAHAWAVGELDPDLEYREAAPAKALSKLPAQAAWEALRRDRTDRWRGVWYLSAPILVFLAMLWGLSRALKADASFSDALSQRIFPNAERAAPPGLLISGLKHRATALDDGERIHLISGTLENHAGETVRDVMLEALTFDAAGRKIAQAKVNAGSTLAGSRVKDLNLPMVREIQARVPAQRFEIKPDERVKFAIAVRADADRPAHFYTARVYSVKP